MRQKPIFALILFSISILHADFPKVGKKAPKIEVAEWVTGKISGKNPFEGKTIILEFWATWCQPCIAAIPHLNELSDKLASSQVVFVSITNEGRGLVEYFLKKHQMKSSVVIDTEVKTHESYGVTSIPHTFLIDEKGILRWHGYPTELTERSLAEFLKSGIAPKMAEPPKPVAHASSSAQTIELPQPYSHRQKVKYSFQLMGKVHLQLTDSLSIGEMASFAVFNDGRLSVGDLRDGTVKIFSSDGKFIKNISRKGSRPGETQTLVCHCIDDYGRVWITDYGLQRVSVYDTSGAVQDTWSPLDGRNNWHLTSGITRVANNRIYVGIIRGIPDLLNVNSISSLVTAFDFNRKPFAEYGSFEKKIADYSVGFDRYEFDVDSSGNLYGVSEYSCDIWKYSPDGAILKRFNYPVSEYRPANPQPKSLGNLREWYTSMTTKGKMEIVGKYLFISFVNKDQQWAESFELRYWHEYLQVFDLDGSCLVDSLKVPGRFLCSDESGVLYFRESDDPTNTIISKYRFSLTGE